MNRGLGCNRSLLSSGLLHLRRDDFHARLGPPLLRQYRCAARQWRWTGTEISLGRSFILHSQNVFRHLSAAIFDNGRLPISVPLAKIFQKAARKTVFSQSRLELAVVLQF